MRLLVMPKHPVTKPPTTLAAVLANLPVELVAGAVSDGLVAEVSDRAGCVRPDYRTRLDAAKLTLSYVLGTPPQASPPPEGEDADRENLETLDALRRSPALRDAVRALLEQAESEAEPRRTRGSGR